jgi:PhnB protein
MQVNPYLSFNGDCEAAFRCYERVFGGQLGTIYRYAGSPMAGDVPADWSDKVMHTTLTIGNLALNGGDVAPEHYEAPKGFSLSVNMTSEVDAERIFRELAEGGRVIVPLAKTFWAQRFGQAVDRFGIQWMINCEGSESPAM